MLIGVHPTARRPSIMRYNRQPVSNPVSNIMQLTEVILAAANWLAIAKRALPNPSKSDRTANHSNLTGDAIQADTKEFKQLRKPRSVGGCQGVAYASRNGM